MFRRLNFIFVLPTGFPFLIFVLLGLTLFSPSLVNLTPQSAAAETPDCSKLSDLDCWSTKGCVLDCKENGTATRCSPYHCRKAVDQCESARAQKDLNKENCEQDSSCVFDQANCFCPGPMNCFCGGGKPSTCHRH